MMGAVLETGEKPQPGDPVKLHGWEGGERGNEVVTYLPGAEPPILVVWMPGRSGFHSRGQTAYYPARIHVFELSHVLEPIEGRPGRYQAVGNRIVDFPGSYRKPKKAVGRPY